MTGKEIADQRIRFETEHNRRAESRKNIGKPGHCPECGEKCGRYSKCRKCRLASYIDRGAVAHWIAPGPRLNEYPTGEYAPTPKSEPLPDIIWEQV